MNQSTAFFVATAIPYVNAPPHLGHALLFTYGDVLARYYSQMGRDVIFSIGTDEHGAKINEQAKILNLEPQIFVDQMSVKVEQMAQYLDISYTHFIRTTDAKHRQGVALIWQKLKDYIYKDVYEGWYCQGCEEYKTEVEAKASAGVCPYHQQAYTWLKEENYFFRLSAFTKRLQTAIEADQLRIIPQAAKNETLSMLQQGLADFSISRLRRDLPWGIAVPDDPDQVIYVWLDALSNYITVLDYPHGRAFQTHWPADVQIIGRDILRFHAIYWPAMLLGLELPLYKILYVHGLVTVEGQKMSKTLGNTVNPLDLTKTYGLNAFRYFFLRHLPAYDNGDFSLQRFIDTYNNELVNQLGNLVHRLQTLIWNKLAGQLPRPPKPKFNQPHLEASYHDYMQVCHFNQALNLLFLEIKALNRNLEESQPWLLTEEAQIRDSLSQIVVNLRQVGQFLRPFLPQLAQQIEVILGAPTMPAPTQPLLPKITVGNIL